MTDDVKTADVEVIFSNCRIIAENINKLIKLTNNTSLKKPSGSDPNMHLVKCAVFLTDALKEAAALYFELKDKE